MKTDSESIKKYNLQDFLINTRKFKDYLDYCKKKNLISEKKNLMTELIKNIQNKKNVQNSLSLTEHINNCAFAIIFSDFEVELFLEIDNYNPDLLKMIFIQTINYCIDRQKDLLNYISTKSQYLYLKMKNYNYTKVEENKDSILDNEINESIESLKKIVNQDLFNKSEDNVKILYLKIFYELGVYYYFNSQFKDSEKYLKFLESNMKINQNLQKYLYFDLLSVSNLLKYLNNQIEEKEELYMHNENKNNLFELESIDVIINEEVGSVTLNVYTGSKSDYSGPTITVDENNFYLKMSSTIYASGAYTYAAYINDTWYKASYAGLIEEKSESGGGGWFLRPGPGGGGGGPQTTITVYYKYVIEKPEGASSFTLYRFAGSDVTEFSTTDYNAKSTSKTFSSTYDMIAISSISSKTITLGSWSSEDDNGTSQKGIKCENEIKISGGTITLRTVDDGIHANYDGALENGLLPVGNVTVSGGTLDIESGDDGIHADYGLYISGGSINVSKSYEGIEGTVINVSGGTTKVVASNDGVNARTGQHDSSITVSGGVLDVTVPSSGDSDGIDSNGTYTQTGGIVIARGPNSTNMAALDTDGTCRIDGGTIIVLGALGEKGMTRGSGVNQISGLSLHSSGSHTVTIAGESLTFTNAYSYAKTICYSSVSVTA